MNNMERIPGWKVSFEFPFVVRKTLSHISYFHAFFQTHDLMVSTAYFTFVAVDPETKRPLKIPPLDPQTWLEKDQFEAGQRRAQQRKEERKRLQNFENPLDPAIEKEALRLLRAAGPLRNIPSLANPHNILVQHTKLQNCEIAQPQTSNLANQIFGGFLMRRAWELSYATAYVFGGARPRFLEVDKVSFSIPVHVGDLTNFQAHVIYTEVQDEIKDFNLFRGQKTSRWCQ
jgi:acyl-coenzyme A thioesterase 9